ncbi:MAG TPA: hypothetical protein VM118_14010, partial [Acidobacteriota bacterium]|nr:hypothetical protein [Acidobacteriota bacterium]
MTLRVLFSDSSRGWSGIQKWMVLSAKEFSRRGWQTIAAGRPENEFVRRADSAGVETVVWPFAGDFDPRTITAALDLMRRRRIDLVVAVAPRDIRTVGIAAWLSRRPVVFR